MKVMTIVMFAVIIGSTLVRAVRNYKVNKFAKRQFKQKKKKESQTDSVLK